MGGHRRHKRPIGQIQNQKCLTVPQRRLVWNNAPANQTPCHSHTNGTSFPYWPHQNSSVLTSVYYIYQQHHHPRQQRQADSCPQSLCFFRGLQIWMVMDLDSISYWGVQLVELSLACTKSTGFNHLHLIKPHMGGRMVVISELKRRQYQKFKVILSLTVNLMLTQGEKEIGVGTLHLYTITEAPYVLTTVVVM